MIKSDINLELNYSNSEGILNEHKDNNYVYNFTENSKFSVKSLKTNKVDHNGYYTIYDDNNIVLISNGGKKYESMSYKLILDLNINNDFEEEITCNFQIESLKERINIKGEGTAKFNIKKKGRKREKKYKCNCHFCDYCLINNPTNKTSNKTIEN